MKEKLLNALGNFGVVLYYIIGFLVTLMPMMFFHLPVWLFFLLSIVFQFVIQIPIFGNIIHLGLWIWSFINVLSEPFDFWVVLYYIALAVYVAVFLIPTIIAFIPHKQD